MISRSGHLSQNALTTRIRRTENEGDSFLYHVHHHNKYAAPFDRQCGRMNKKQSKWLNQTQTYPLLEGKRDLFPAMVSEINLLQ